MAGDSVLGGRGGRSPLEELGAVMVLGGCDRGLLLPVALCKGKKLG